MILHALVCYEKAWNLDFPTTVAPISTSLGCWCPAKGTPHRVATMIGQVECKGLQCGHHAACNNPPF